MKKGKAFAHTKDRNHGDYYPTHYSLTEQLLEVVDFRHGIILEPAAGKAKAISKVLERNGLSVVSKDLEQGQDFLKEVDKYEYIITNPPYSLADEFVEKCKEVATDKFALLLRTNFLSGMKRFRDKRV